MDKMGRILTGQTFVGIEDRIYKVLIYYIPGNEYSY